MGFASLPSSNNWSFYDFTLPSETGANPTSFYGGRLMVSYDGLSADTFNWTITVRARPVLTQ
jgi:hypothetical protein